MPLGASELIYHNNLSVLYLNRHIKSDPTSLSRPKWPLGLGLPWTAKMTPRLYVTHVSAIVKKIEDFLIIFR